MDRALGEWARTSRSGEKEIETLRPGLDLGATLIDTAEMYGEGSAEKLVGKAMEGRRDTVFLVDKVLPQNASRRGMVQAYDGSLRRLGTDRIDLYLLHWRGTIPLHEPLEAFTTLQRDGKILAGRRKPSSIPFIHSTPWHQ